VSGLVDVCLTIHTVLVLIIVLFVIPVLLALAVYVSGGPSEGQGPNFLDRVSHNGVFAALADFDRDLNSERANAMIGATETSDGAALVRQ